MMDEGGSQKGRFVIPRGKEGWEEDPHHHLEVVLPEGE